MMLSIFTIHVSLTSQYMSPIYTDTFDLIWFMIVFDTVARHMSLVLYEYTYLF